MQVTNSIKSCDWTFFFAKFSTSRSPMFGDMSPSARTRIQSSTDRGIGLTSTPMRKRSSPSKKASSSSRSPVFGDRSPVMCRELSPNAKGIGLTLLPKETRSSPCVRVEADAEFNAWCNGTLGSSNRHRKKASDMSQTEINQHMLNFTYVVMDALDIKSVLQNKKRSLKTNMDNDKVEDDPILGCLPLTTKEQYFDLEEKLKNDSFVKTWKMSLLEHTKALTLTTFATTTAAKMIMKEIFSPDMLKTICYAGNKTSGEKKVAVKNGSVYSTLIAVLKHLGHKDVAKIEKGLKDAMFKANNNVTKEFRKKKFE